MKGVLANDTFISIFISTILASLFLGTPVLGQESLPMLPYSVYHLGDPNAPCADSPCETIAIRFSQDSMMTFGARNLTGQNIFWDSTFQFSDDSWTQYVLGFYQLWIDGIIWGNSTRNASSTCWTNVKSFRISEINESYSGIYPQLSFNITFEEIGLPDVEGNSNNVTLIISHRITGKEDEALIKLSICLDLTNFIPYWNNSGVLAPFAPDQHIFIGIMYRTNVIASRNRDGSGRDWIVPASYNASSVNWVVDGHQCTSMQFERNAKRRENTAWFDENASSSINPGGYTVIFFNHVVPNCSANTTRVFIDPIIAVNGDFAWWSEDGRGFPPWATALIIAAAGVVVVVFVVLKRRRSLARNTR
nr:hypothetical protein [Candidatus Sigynarchaeum springense]